MQQSAKLIESRSVRAAEMNNIPQDRSGDRALSMLVADDDASVVGLLVNYATRMGFDVDTAHRIMVSAIELAVEGRASGCRAMNRAPRSRGRVISFSIPSSPQHAPHTVHRVTSHGLV